MSERVTADELRRIRSHLLTDVAVRAALTGFLVADLKNQYGIEVSRAALEAALEGYVEAIDTGLGEAAALFNSGMRVT